MTVLGAELWEMERWRENVGHSLLLLQPLHLVFGNLCVINLHVDFWSRPCLDRRCAML